MARIASPRASGRCALAPVLARAFGSNTLGRLRLSDDPHARARSGRFVGGVDDLEGAHECLAVRLCLAAVSDGIEEVTDGSPTAGAVARAPGDTSNVVRSSAT